MGTPLPPATPKAAEPEAAEVVIGDVVYSVNDRVVIDMNYLGVVSLLKQASQKR